MQTIVSKIKKIALILALVFIAGCNPWLDIDPVGVQTSGTFWKTKEEAEQVLISSYMQMRECVPLFLKWGELRGDGIAFGPAHDADNGSMGEAERMIRNLDIRPSNTLNQWNEVYTAIGRANMVLKFSSTALEFDATFAKSLSDSYEAEAIFVRSLMYFYLVRTFKDVPFTLEPYSDDSQDFYVDVTSSDIIIARLIDDLEEYKTKAKPGYEEPWQSKGRATSWSIKALLADLYLWRGEGNDYQKVIEIAEEFEHSPYALMGLNRTDREKEEETNVWIEIYYPGNSKEAIFELQFRDLEHQRNNLYNWFWGGDRYLISPNTRDLFEKVDASEFDIRGYDSGYGETSDNKLWKYGGTKISRGNFVQGVRNSNIPVNWIFYRYADIILMKAEALAMTGDYQGVSVALEPILERAGFENTVPSTPSDEKSALSLVMKERQKEFVGEGKRWFDILRMARRDDYRYKSDLIQLLVESIPPKDRGIWRYRLENEYSHYLPIHTEEIKAAHGVLTQNPFYKDVE